MTTKSGEFDEGAVYVVEGPKKFFEKLLQNPLTLSRYGYIIKTQKRKGDHENDRNEIFRNRGWYT